MVVAQEDHRSQKFPELSLACIAGLKKIFRTETALPIMFPSSGTGCWEAALTNCLNPGDKLLAARFGQFSHLWIDMCQRLGFTVEVMEEEWGTGANPDHYRQVLAADQRHDIKAVLVCQNETATGVNSDVSAIRAVLDELKHPALLFVDSVSALGSVDFRMDDWRVDVCVSGSQKRPDAARRHGHHLRQPKGARNRENQEELPLLLRLQRHGAGVQDGLLPLHAVDPDALRAARSARDAARGGS
jgi:alanine-glyoxylate transaminase/serine-glyoxylate transaminase/serine-pyruvate transaminase